jgi:hypothetical protein
MVCFNSIRPMSDKLKSIDKWPRPANVHDVRPFLGLCGYYRRYVKNFAKLASPLHNLTARAVKKRQPVDWLLVLEHAFQELKLALTSGPVLLMPDLGKPFVVETDASDYAVGAVLLQHGDNVCLHPVSFESCELNSSQRKYPAQERELLAILHAWQKWSLYLHGAVATTVVYTDHSLLQCLANQKMPSPRLCRWIDEFSKMDILVKYKKGSENVVPDALSRRADLVLIDEIGDQLHCTNWPLIIPYLDDGQDIPAEVSKEAIQQATTNKALFKYDPAAETMVYLGQLGLQEVSPFNVPFAHRLDLLQQVHNKASHQGRDCTLQLLCGCSWWPRQYEDVKAYIQTCTLC